MFICNLFVYLIYFYFFFFAFFSENLYAIIPIIKKFGENVAINLTHNYHTIVYTQVTVYYLSLQLFEIRKIIHIFIYIYSYINIYFKNYAIIKSYIDKNSFVFKFFNNWNSTSHLVIYFLFFQFLNGLIF